LKRSPVPDLTDDTAAAQIPCDVLRRVYEWGNRAGTGEGDDAGFGGPPAYAVAGNPIIATADTIDIA
jgi:hypothetical protein